MSHTGSHWDSQTVFVFFLFTGPTFDCVALMKWIVVKRIVVGRLLDFIDP